MWRGLSGFNQENSGEKEPQPASALKSIDPQLRNELVRIEMGHVGKSIMHPVVHLTLPKNNARIFQSIGISVKHPRIGSMVGETVPKTVMPTVNRGFESIAFIAATSIKTMPEPGHSLVVDSPLPKYGDL